MNENCCCNTYSTDHLSDVKPSEQRRISQDNNENAETMKERFCGSVMFLQVTRVITPLDKTNDSLIGEPPSTRILHTETGFSAPLERMDPHVHTLWASALIESKYLRLFRLYFRSTTHHVACKALEKGQNLPSRPGRPGSPASPFGPGKPGSPFPPFTANEGGPGSPFKPEQESNTQITQINTSFLFCRV